MRRVLLLFVTIVATAAGVTAQGLEIKNLSDTITWGHDTTDLRNTCTMIVIHSNYYAGRDRSRWDLQGCIDQFYRYGVAPHYMIDRGGTIYRLTPDSLVAYHAGVSVLPGDTITGLNKYSLGIEIINSKTSGPTTAQYRQLAALVNDLVARYDITHIMGHADVAPRRKTDPWAFSWPRLESLLATEARALIVHAGADDAPVRSAGK